MAYTAEDRDAFGVEAYLEMCRIKDLVASAPQESSTDSLKSLLKDKSILIEELVGIEHLVIGSPTTVKRVRREHSNAVLRKQREQQMQAEDPTSLAKFAKKLSRKSCHSARARAAMAALNRVEE